MTFHIPKLLLATITRSIPLAIVVLCAGVNPAEPYYWRVAGLGFLVFCFWTYDLLIWGDE